MSRSTNLKIKFSLAILLLVALACDTSSLDPFAQPTSTPASGPQQFPGPDTLGTTSEFRPSAAGWIAFVNQNNLWLIHPDGSGLKQITRNPAPSDPASRAGDFNLRWSADGQMLAYSQGGTLSVLDITSLATTALVSDTAGGFDWAPNGQQILYDGAIKAGGQPSNTGLWIMHVPSQRTWPFLKSGPDYPTTIMPHWSYDGTHVLFSEPADAKPGGIHLIDVVTGKVMKLMVGDSGDITCNWSPVALLIACINGNPPKGQEASVVFLDEAGKQQREIALSAGALHARVGPWSPDGGRLAVVYSSDANGSQETTDILTWDSGKFNKIGAGRASDWSPDGRWLVTDGSSGSEGQAAQPITVINSTSGLTSTLSEGSVAVWQPGIPESPVAGAATQQAFCSDTTVAFTHTPQGYSLQLCVGLKHYIYGPLEKGVYALGPGGQFFVYCSGSGFVYAARVGDKGLTQIGNVRDFIAIRTKGADPRFQIRFPPTNRYRVQIVELGFAQDETFTLPRRIAAP